MKNKKHIWTMIRAIIFLTVGLMNTVFIKYEDIGTWKNYFGYAFLIVALIDIAFVISRILNARK